MKQECDLGMDSKKDTSQGLNKAREVPEITRERRPREGGPFIW